MAKLNAQRRTLLQTDGVGAAGLLTAAGLTLAGAQCNAQSGGLSSSLRALLSGRQWLNTAALNEGDVAGRVVLSGAWNVGAEYATLDAPGGAVRFRFHARDLHFVLGRGSQTIRYRITIDGAAPGDNAGTDVNAAGEGVIDAARMYQLVRQSGRIQDRTFEITFLDPGAHAYVFTFG